MLKNSDKTDQRVKIEPPEDTDLNTSLIRSHAAVTETPSPASRSQESQVRAEGPNLWNSQFDPSSGAPMSARDRELFTFYLEEVTSLVLPIGVIRQSWNQSITPVALAEPALLHAILAFSSSHLKSLKAVPLAKCLELVNSHKMTAIQLVNQQLQDVQSAIQPSVIVTIYLLAAQEMLFDNDVQASRAHLLGLRDVIRLRGGFGGLPLPMMTYLIVIDLAYAASSHLSPIFSADILPLLPGPTNRMSVASSQYLNPSFLTQRYQSQLKPHMLETYRNLSVILTYQEYALEASLASKPNILTVEETASYDSLRLPTLYNLLMFLVGNGPEDNTQTLGYKNKSTGLTPIQAICGVVIPIVALQDQFLPYRRSTFTGSLADRLYITLTTEVDLEACWATYPEVMIWAMMFGVYTSRGNSTEMEVWFLKQLVKGIRGRKGQVGQLGGNWKWGWDTVKPVLRRFYWCERLFGDEFEEICELLTPAMGAASHTSARALDHLTLTACSKTDPQASADDQYAELIRCFKDKARL